MNIYLIINFFIGTCFASHACVIYDRFEIGNYFFKRSICPNCNFEIRFLDSIPLISYLFLKGKCRFCHAKIPTSLFLFEFFGGVAFCKINFSNQDDCLQAIFTFFLLLCAVFDYYDYEFPTSFLLSMSYLAILKITLLTLIDLIIIASVVFLFLYYVVHKKMGLGDLYIYLLISIYFTSSAANLIFLGACIIIFFIFIFEKEWQNNTKKPFAFVPYIFFSFSFYSLLI